MPINEAIYNKIAKRRDVGNIAINVSVALDAIAAALEGIRDTGKPTERDIASIRKAAKELENAFDALSGWTNEQR